MALRKIQRGVKGLGIRMRLMLLVGLALLPSVLLIGYLLYTQREVIASNYKEQSLQIARIAAAQQEDNINATKQLLVALAANPDLQNTAECTRTLGEVIKQHRIYANIGVVNTSGAVLCSARPASSPIDEKDRPYINKVSEKRDFAGGEYQLNRQTNKSVLNYGYPILRNGVDQVVFAEIDLEAINTQISEARFPAQSVVTIYDPKFIVLARQPEPRRFVGHSGAHTEVARGLTKNIEGTVETKGIDGVERLYGYTRVRGGLDPIYVSVGYPVSAAFSNIYDTILTALVGLLIAAVVIFALSWTVFED